MKSKALIVIIAGVIVMGGCMPQSNYAPESFDVPDDFRIAEVSTETDTIAFTGDSMIFKVDSSKLAWKNYFKDEKLIKLVEAGLENNFDVRQAYKRIEMYRLQFKQSNMEFLPSLNATVANTNYQYRSENFYSNPSSNWYDHNGQTPPATLYNYTNQNLSGINFSWEIDIWGKIRSQRAEHLFNYLASVEGKKALQTQLVSDIASGYYNLLLLYAQLQVAESNFALSERTLKMVELQYTSGNTTALAKQQTKSQMLATKALIPALKQEISEQENRLQFLTGKLPSELNIEEDNFELNFNSIERRYEVPLDIVRYRTDIRKAEYELWAANANVGVTQTRQYPSLVIDLGIGVNSMLPVNWFSIPGSLFGSLIGNLTQPLFNKKRNKTAFEQAKLEREIKEIEVQKKVYGAIMEISNILTIMNALDEQIEIAEEQVATSELTISQSNLLFNSGYATYLEVITAQRVALESELKLNSLKEKRLQMKIQMYRALGGGW